MRMRNPTHTGIITNKDGKTKEAALIEYKLTWRDADTKQLYSKANGCVRPASMWDTRTLDLSSIQSIGEGK